MRFIASDSHEMQVALFSHVSCDAVWCRWEGNPNLLHDPTPEHNVDGSKEEGPDTWYCRGLVYLEMLQSSLSFSGWSSTQTCFVFLSVFMNLIMVSLRESWIAIIYFTWAHEVTAHTDLIWGHKLRRAGEVISRKYFWKSDDGACATLKDWRKVSSVPWRMWLGWWERTVCTCHFVQ